MSGFDLIVKDEITLQQLQAAVALALDVSENQVAIFEGYPEVDLPINTKILCMRTDVGGEYSSHLSIEILDDGVYHDLISIASKISKGIKSDCLLPDSSQNPYSMSLISPDVPIKQVLLYADDLDNGSYCVIVE